MGLTPIDSLFDFKSVYAYARLIASVSKRLQGPPAKSKLLLVHA